MHSLKHALKKISAVIVTGGSSGIGASFIASILKYGDSVAVCNLSRSEPEKKFQEAGVSHIPVDLSQGQEIARVVPEIEAFLAQHPDGEVLLINNSGFGGYGEFDEVGHGHQLAMIDLNIRACVDLSHRLLPVLRKRGGGIMNIASIASFQPTPLMTTYGATKAFVQNWSLGLSDELKGTRVKVLCVCPGPTESNFFRAAGFTESQIKYGQTAEQVVNESLAAYGKGKWIVTTGFLNKLSVAISSKLPRVLVTKLAGATLRKVRKQ